MPFGDGTGPWGAFKNCVPVDAQGNPIKAPFYGRRFFGRGHCRGLGWRFYAQPVQLTSSQEKESPETQRKTIEEEISQLKQELESIKERIKELKKE